VPEDDAEAVRWYRLAAEQEYPIAQFKLAGMYSRGEGVPRNEAEAIRWYRLAAEQGDALAQTNLGVILTRRWHRYQLEPLEGTDLAEAGRRSAERDLVRAFMWFTLSAAQGNEAAQTNMGVIERWLTSAQIAEAQRLSRERNEGRAQEGNEPSETIRIPRIPNRPR
ncbi:MAG: tetratricopeptide repeat protein, partial [Gemmatimonadota bacterium]|nr:tetratricopeptide repeat protein [Gemmatimonadota bacterium]